MKNFVKLLKNRFHNQFGIIIDFNAFILGMFGLIKRNFTVITVICFMLLSNTAIAHDLEISYINKRCYAKFWDKQYYCSIGRNGVTGNKTEGDEATPTGKFSLREIFYRADKIKMPHNIKLPIRKLHKYHGWCDDPKHENYNKLVDLRKFDLQYSHEKLYTVDPAYDIIIVVGYNDDPVQLGKGSAIFIHIAEPHYTGTAGCIGFSKTDLIEIISKLECNSNVIIE